MSSSPNGMDGVGGACSRNFTSKSSEAHCKYAYCTQYTSDWRVSSEQLELETVCRVQVET